MLCEILETFLLGFLIGLTGALAPGPTLIATINSSLKGGWIMGPKVTLGHVVVEVLMVVFIVVGISMVIGAYSPVIAGIGGTALILFGILTINEGIGAKLDNNRMECDTANPFLAGVITSISNPYFWIWWFTVGSALLLSALRGGALNAIAFIVGHWAADLGWLTLVSAGIHRGRFLMGEREYRWVLVICGAFLVLFGVYYHTTVSL